MSNEQKDWEWENRQDAQRAIALMEEAHNILTEPLGIACTSTVVGLLSAAVDTLRIEIED